MFWLWLLGGYRLRLRLSIRGEIEQILEAAALQIIFAFALLFLFHYDSVSRLFLLGYSVALAAVTIAGRGVIREGFFALRRRGLSARYALVVGTGAAAQEWADLLENHAGLGITVIGHLSEEHEPPPVVSRPVLGTTSGLETVLAGAVVDEVGIALPPRSWGMVQAIAGVALEGGKIVRIPMRDGTFTLPGGRIDDLEGLPVLSIVRGPERFVALAVKRLVDIAGAAVGLVLLSPLFLAVAVYIRGKDGSPVLFRQIRVGVNGRPFTLIKFRTMARDAEARLDEARLDEVRPLNEMTGSLFKVTKDPRITSWGARLRRTSIDELPQLWSVLKGEMSLVGPRPAPPREVEGYDLWHRRRLSMRPGITGLWQVSSRLDGVPERLFVAPEFLRQGSALQDIRRPTRVVAGTFGEDADPDALALVTRALAQPGTPLLVMRAEEASLVKNASSVFLALRLTVANEVAGLAEDPGVDVGPVLDGIGYDPRIGHMYMRPSYGFVGAMEPG